MSAQQKVVRTLYQTLLRLYPYAFREKFGASMLQTFNDLCNERQREGRQRWVGFVAWLFIETVGGVIDEHAQRIRFQQFRQGVLMKTIIMEWALLLRQRKGIKPRKTMEIRYMSVLVDDQDKALHFYTEKLGFMKKNDVPDGDSPLRWLTVVSPDGPDGVELELQATHFPSAKAYQKDQYDAGYAYAIFQTKDIYAEYQRLKQSGVVFRGEPEDAGPVLTVKFEDTCGNLINMIQPKM